MTEKDDDMVAAERHLQSVSEDFDPFAADTSKEYDPDEYITRSVDARGHKETVHVALPPTTFGRINELVASRIISAYRTPQDFVRDAINHRLHYIGTKIKDDAIIAAVDYERMVCGVEALAKELEQLTAVVETTERMLETAATTRDKIALNLALRRAEHDAGLLRSPYDIQMRNLIERYYERLNNL